MTAAYTLRRLIEMRPLQATMAMSLLLLPIALILSLAYAEIWKTNSTQQVLRTANARLAAQNRTVAERVDAEFSKTRKLAELISTDSRFVDMLHAKDPALIRELNFYLTEFASNLHLHRAFVLDANGICIASNDHANAKTLVGTNLADRDYFNSAMAGNPAVQFVVGRVSTVPGFHFSAPIYLRGNVIGVITLKIDLEALADHVRLSSGFVTDNQGVIVLSDNPELLLLALPQSPALAMTRSDLQLRYQRDMLHELPITTIRVGDVEAFTYGERPHPSLRMVTPLVQDSLVIHAFQSLDAIVDINEAYGLRFYMALLASYCALMLLGCASVYLVRDAYQRRNLLILNAELQKQAQHDALTGCYNRRMFDEVLRTELQRASRHGRTLTLALIDLDHFKLVNDSFGHHVGDTMLVHMATLLRSDLRSTDTLARIGGEEFALLLPETDEAEAYQILCRMLQRAKQRPLLTDSQSINQTFSAGIASASDAASQHHLLQRADLALYTAKHCGRDRIIRASKLEPAATITTIDTATCPADD